MAELSADVAPGRRLARSIVELRVRRASDRTSVLVHLATALHDVPRTDIAAAFVHQMGRRLRLDQRDVDIVLRDVSTMG